MKEKNNIWKYVLFGGIIGIIFGILIIVLEEVIPDFLRYPAFAIIYLIPNATNCSEIACALFYVVSAIIAYTIIGLFIGMGFYYFSIKKQK